MLFKNAQKNKKVNTASGIELIEVAVYRREKDTSILQRILIGILASASIFGILLTSFQWGLGTQVYSLMGLGIAVCSFLIFMQFNKRIELMMNVLVAAGMIIGVWIFRGVLRNGIVVMINRVITSINAADHRLWHEFAVSGTPRSQEADLKIAMFMSILLVSWLLAWIIKYTDTAALAILEGILIGSVLYFSCEIHILFAVFGCAACSGLWVMAASGYAGHMRPVMLVIAACMFCMGGILLAAEPGKDYESPVVMSIQEYITSRIEQIRYGTDTLPGGVFEKGLDTKNDEEVRMRVTVSGNDQKYEVYQPLYLRGFTGTTYETDRFRASDREIYAGSYLGMFDYLETLNFQPQYQVGRYLELDAAFDAASGRDKQCVNIAIENLDANRKYLYAPSGITKEGGSLLNGDVVYDTMLFAGGAFGQKEYSCQAWVTDSELQNGTVENLWMDHAEDYGASYEAFALGEKVYREFVYDTYLELPKELEKELESTDLDVLGGTTIGDVLQSVRTYLKTYATYDAGSDWTLEGRGLLSAFLEEEQSGNAMHFAAAGTLLFRMCNVPARYVEGYYLSEKILRTGESVYEVTDQNAHAWVEIYLDGIGFVPMEVTPGFYQSESVQPQSVDIQTMPTTHKAESVYEHAEAKVETKIRAGQILWMVSLILLGSAVAILIRRSILRRKWKNALAGEDSAMAVSAVCRYMEVLLQCIRLAPDFREADQLAEMLKSDLGADIAEGYIESIHIVRKIRFSEAPLTKAERVYLTEYLDKLKKTVWKVASRRQKVKISVWRGL